MGLPLKARCVWPEYFTEPPSPKWARLAGNNHLTYIKSFLSPVSLEKDPLKGLKGPHPVGSILMTNHQVKCCGHIFIHFTFKTKLPRTSSAAASLYITILIQSISKQILTMTHELYIAAGLPGPLCSSTYKVTPS